MNEVKKYSINFLLSILLILLSISVFNWLVNPYDIFLSPNIEGVNLYKSEVERYTRLSKAYQIENIKPEVIFLASSRGLVFTDDMLADGDVSAMNLSLASGSTYELYRMLQHAHAVQPLKKVILAVDEVFSDTVQTSFSEERLSVNVDGSINGHRWLQKVQDNFSSLFSIDALRASLRTLRKQGSSSTTSAHDASRVANAGGHRQMFNKMEVSVFNKNKGEHQSCIDESSQKGNAGKASIYFEEIVDFSYKKNIELIVYISPSHARFYEIMCMTAQWPRIEAVKKHIVNTVEIKAKEYSSEPYIVWDFSGYNSITSENVPLKGDKLTLMKWYWEGSHYTRDTAAKIFGRMRESTGASSDFGVIINADNIQHKIDADYMARENYVRTDGDDLEELKNVMKLVNIK